MAYTVPPLPYPFDALEPYIDAKTMEIHHDKHHKAYVDNLNKAIEGTDLGNQPVEKLIANLASVPEKIRTAVQNNGGGHANHSLFWTIMGKGKGGKPSGALAEAINKDLGGFEQFTKDFTQNGLTQFGSGWTWLYVDHASGKQALGKTPNQDSPLMKGNTPILGCDVWEHAYYLKYQNRRPDYLAQFWNVIDWDAVAARFAAAKKS
jgi:Fe-Mn family superoxide dismutase